SRDAAHQLRRIRDRWESHLGGAQMARGSGAATSRAKAPPSKPRELKLSKDYTFKRVGRNRFAVLGAKGEQVFSNGAQFGCVCSTRPGSCRVEVFDNQTLRCTEETCFVCHWSVLLER